VQPDDPKLPLSLLDRADGEQKRVAGDEAASGDDPRAVCQGPEDISIYPVVGDRDLARRDSVAPDQFDPRALARGYDALREAHRGSAHQRGQKRVERLAAMGVTDDRKS